MKFPGPPGIDAIPTNILSTWPPITDINPFPTYPSHGSDFFDVLLLLFK